MRKNKLLNLGVDCGGTNIKMALVDADGNMVRSKLEAIRYDRPAEITIKDMARRLKKFLKSGKTGTIKSAGIGIAGDIDQSKGMVRFSPNLGWYDIPFKSILEKELRIPVCVDNDANCAAWGAYWLDARRDCKNLICLTLGTGIGGGIIIDKKLYRGATGSAGELGHMTIQYQGRACKCGNYGCIESLAGAWGLNQTAEDGLKQNLAPILKNVLARSGNKPVSPKLIALAAGKGDGYCRQLWRDAGEQLGAALSNLVNIFNPERIVLCGGVSKAGPLLMEPVLHSLGMRAFKAPVRAVKVTISKYDDRLGVVGAALLLSY